MKDSDYYYILVDEPKEKSLVSLGHTHNLNEVIQFGDYEEAYSFAQKHLADKKYSVIGVLESKK